MEKIELLAPAGDIDSFYAAISNGADSIYLGGTLFNARAYASNFNQEELAKAVYFAHINNVKVFVTLNTLIFDDEIDLIKQYIEMLYLTGIDGIIVQDFGIINYILDHYKDLKLTCSTQTTITDLKGVHFFEKLGVNRIVLARELDISTVENIKKQCKTEIEIFVHGALCVCYSGQCLMSSMIGGRSGNRGTCAQPCRKKYELIHQTNHSKLSKKEYLLSMKDLKTIDHLDIIMKANIDSLKIEGRMKSPNYVANVISCYKNVLDSHLNNKKINLEDINVNLSKTFNRTYTDGHLFNQDSINLVNTKRPNNCGYLIGKITNASFKGYVELLIEDDLRQEDYILIEAEEDIIYKIVMLYDQNFNLINRVNHGKCYIKIKEKVYVNNKIFKVTDYDFEKKMQLSYPKIQFRLPLDIMVEAHVHQPLSITFIDKENRIVIISERLIEKAQKNPITKENIYEQLSKLNETPYRLNSIIYDLDENIFIDLKLLNDLRRRGINQLYEQKQFKRQPQIILPYKPEKQIPMKSSSPSLSVKVRNEAQYHYIKSLGIDIIYFENICQTINSDYTLTHDEILVANYGGLFAYQDRKIIADYSLNTSNYLSVYHLLNNGVSRVTLSLELLPHQLKVLAESFFATFDCYPPLEYLVYGRTENMISKYCLLKNYGQCGQCKKNQYILADDYTQFPLITDNNCCMHIYHDRPLNRISEIKQIAGHVNVIRLEFFNESFEEIKRIIDACRHALQGE